MKVIYSRFNKERLPQYQTSTTIYSDEFGRRYVQKRALTEEALVHIRNIHENCGKLRLFMNDVEIAQSNLDGDAVSFEYISSSTYESLLFKELKDNNKEKLYSYFNYYKLMLLQQPLNFVETFIADHHFSKVFGDDISLSLSNVMCHRIANVDLTFDNITFENGQFTIYDYEWVFEMDVPVDFVLFRSINEFYTKHADYLKHVSSKNDILRFLGINPDHLPIFEKMEEGFQRYVFGTAGEYRNTEKVLKQILNLDDLVSARNEIGIKNEEIRLLGEELEKVKEESIHLNNQISYLNKTNNKLLKVTEELTFQLSTKSQQLVGLQEQHFAYQEEKVRKYLCFTWMACSKQILQFKRQINPPQFKEKSLLETCFKVIKKS
jgi:O-antigen biosynthesis protein